MFSCGSLVGGGEDSSSADSVSTLEGVSTLSVWEGVGGKSSFWQAISAIDGAKKHSAKINVTKGFFFILFSVVIKFALKNAEIIVNDFYTLGQ